MIGMAYRARRVVASASFCLVLGVWASLPVEAETIRMKDGTEFSATVLGKDGDSVVIRLPRSDVNTVDGQSLPPPVAAGAKAPEFGAVDLGGTTHALADSKGRPMLLQFWATWCPHCRSDLAIMKGLFARYKDKGLRIISVSVDQDLNRLRSFIRDHEITYPVIAVAEQPPSAGPALPELYEMQGVPAYYLIDAQGAIVETRFGSMTEANVDLESPVKHLLETSSSHAAQAGAPANPSPSGPVP